MNVSEIPNNYVPRHVGQEFWTHHKRRVPVATVIYKTLPEYRIPFFEALRPRLEACGIELRLIYGQPFGLDQLKRDTGHIAWALPVRNRIVNVGSRQLYWQPCLHLLKECDLVIVEQASKLLLNYVLAAKQRFGGPKVAMWGHGRNYQAHSASFVGEAVKRCISRRAHWFFAYNESSAAAVRGFNFPAERTTVVQNAIDTTSLQRKRSVTSEQILWKLRQELGLRSDNIAVFVGGLYAEKRIEFLLASAKTIRSLLPDFELLVIGAGPDDTLVRRAAEQFDWIHYLGARFHEEKVPYMMLAKVMVLPGVVGLAILDSFALEIPLITIDAPNHGPEIGYLNNRVNGFKCVKGTNPVEYGRIVASLMQDGATLSELRHGCRGGRTRYTLEAMVERFTAGVVQALAS
jgi:glycosyltransferase involved in cell wall biosynthesis